MTHLNSLTYEQADPKAQKIFTALNKKAGMVPNVYATTAHSSVALDALLQYGEMLKGGEFNAQEIEAIALAVGEENSCHYCIAAHTAVGKMNGLTDEETLNLRSGKSYNTKLNALAYLAQKIVQTRGYPSDEALQGFFDVGYSKAALVELIGFISLNIFTNYINHIAQTEIDFPLAPQLEAV